MPKIAYVMDQILACGGCLVPFEHCRELIKRGYDAFICANGKNDDIHRAYPDVPIRELPFLDFMKDEDAIVSVWWPQTEWLIEKKGRKIQMVQGRDDLANVGDDVKQKNLSVRKDERWELMGVSKYSLDWTGREGTIIPNGISSRFYEKQNIERDIDILVVGNNEPHKRIDEAISIAQRVGGKIGLFGLTTKFIEGVETFTNPPQSEIPKIYQRSKAVLMLSKSEGFWLPPLEAMASGCLVVCNDAGGNDFCKFGYNCIILGENETGIDLTDNNPILGAGGREYIIKNGIETAKQYTWDKAGELLDKLYKNE